MNKKFTTKKHKNIELKTYRIQKLLAMAAVASRRQIEQMIKLGRIKVNTKVASLGEKISFKDRIFIDNKAVRLKISAKTKIIIFNKPAQYLCSKVSQDDKKTVFELLNLPKNDRWVMVGRLDFNSSGLLLLTNNGWLANQLMHPKNQIIRSYAVRTYPKATKEQINQLKNGIILDDELTKFASISEIKNQTDSEAKNFWYQIELKQGKYREIRRMLESVQLQVSRLIRTQFGPINLPRDLRRGKMRFLDQKEVKTLLDCFDQQNNQLTEDKIHP